MRVREKSQVNEELERFKGKGMERDSRGINPEMELTVQVVGELGTGVRMSAVSSQEA